MKNQDLWDAASELDLRFPPLLRDRVYDMRSAMISPIAISTKCDDATTWIVEAVTAMREVERPLDRMRHLITCERVAECVKRFLMATRDMANKGSPTIDPSMTEWMGKAIREAATLEFDFELENRDET